jgi:chromosome segregation ATPase
MITETRAKSLENEVKNLAKQLDYERTKYSDLETVLAKERENAYRLQVDFGKTEEERISLRGEVEQLRLTARGGSSSEFGDHAQKLEENRNEILNLEMEQMRLREENGKTKHLLFKAESKIADLESQL